MKSILISEANENKIAEAIKECEGRASARCIDAKGIIKAAKDYTTALGVPKTAMLGLHVKVDLNAQRFPRAYKYTPESTQFDMEYTKSGWKLTWIGRAECRNPNHAYSMIYPMSDTLKSALVNRFYSLGIYDV